MQPELHDLDRCGNALCLDFVNTVWSRVDPEARDYLGGYDDLLEWARDGEVLTAEQLRRLRAAAAESPRRAARTHKEAIALREALYRVFTAFGARHHPAGEDLARLNGALERALPHRRVALRRGRYDWAWSGEEDAVESVIWPIALSAADLLVGADPARIRACPPPEGCGWLYLDTSKNGSRRWCSMRTCGSIVKARRYYRRRREPSQTSR